MPKGNDVIPNAHFHKDWQNRVKTWFNQPARKQRRRAARAAKAARIAPRPAQGPLRPAVHAPTIKYNARVREGRGFTLEELKEAGVRNQRYARSIGISVDHRRKNRSADSLRVNAQRLKEYLQRLSVHPRRGRKAAKGEATAEEVSKAVQLQGPIAPIAKQVGRVRARKITDEERSTSVYALLRQVRCNTRMAGIRKRRAELKAAEEAEKKK